MSRAQLEALNGLFVANPYRATTTLDEMRVAVEAAGDAQPYPSDAVDVPGDVGGVRGRWLHAPECESTRVILYLHGGSFVLGSSRSSRHMALVLGRAARSRCFSVDYRLAPEHPFPCAIEDAVAVYRALLEQGFRHTDIALAGDSAGGGLAIAAAIALRDAGVPRPACVVAMSPWLDMTLTSDWMEARLGSDLVLTPGRLADRARMYLGDASAQDPLASPVFADLRGFPSLLLQASSAEILIGDSMTFASRAVAAGTRVTLDVWPDMPHDWQRFEDRLDEGRLALQTAGRFAAAALAGG